MPSVDIQCTVKQREYLNTLLFDDTADIVVYGGSRGSGKTFIDCLALVLRRLMHPGTLGLMLRRTQSAARNTLKSEVDKVLYTCLKLPQGSVKYRVAEKLYLFPNGSQLQLGYCKLDSDYEQYQGAQYADIAWEELTQHTKRAWDMVGGSNRSNAPGCKAKRSGNCNPGGIGHAWVKEEIIESDKGGVRFIPSLPQDNLALLENDPGYIPRVLDPLPEWQRRQWKDGDWNAVSGAYFEIPPAQVRVRQVPYWADWVGGCDWGRAAPFCCLFIAQWQDAEGNRHCHVVREFYRRGLELDEQAHAVTDNEEALAASGQLNAERVRYYADPMTAKALEGSATEAGRTIRSTWANYGFFVLPAHTNARVPGWELVKLLVKHGILTIDPSCKALLKELHGSIYEGTAAGGEPDGEDIDPDCPDHAADSLRYCLVSTYGLSFATDQKNPWQIEERPERELIAA